MRHLILATAFLSGCGSVVPTGIARLSTVSPLEADPADIAVSLALPDGIGITEGSAKLTLMATRTDTDDQTQEVYVLAKDIGTGGEEIYAVAPSDYMRLRTQQAKIRGWEDSNSETTNGSMGVNLAGCIRDDGPASDAKLSINVRTTTGGKFFPLVRNAALQDVFEAGEFEALKPCP